MGPTLEAFTIEDVTTAIETTWKMLGTDPLPKMSFHKETKLLIVVGTLSRTAVARDYVAVDPQHYKVELDNSEMRVVRCRYGD